MSKTKVELANALKKLSHEKQFDKISVSDITLKCNLNRQTFYYHFQDKYECLEWIYHHDCLLSLTNEMTANNWEICIEKTLLIMSKDKEFYINSISDNPRIFMNAFFNTLTHTFYTLVRNYDETNKLPLSASFVSEFLTTGIVGMTMKWVLTGMKDDPHLLVEQFKVMAKQMREMKTLRS